MMGVLDSDVQKKLVDVLIEPDVKSEPSFAFDKAELFIDEGYKSAQGLQDQIDEIKKKIAIYPVKKSPRLASPFGIEYFLLSIFQIVSFHLTGWRSLNSDVPNQAFTV